jgi:hypothetical protein
LIVVKRFQLSLKGLIDFSLSGFVFHSIKMGISNLEVPLPDSPFLPSIGNIRGRQDITGNPDTGNTQSLTSCQKQEQSPPQEKE